MTKEYADKAIKLCDEYLEEFVACECRNEDGTLSQTCRGCPMLDSVWQDGFIKGFDIRVKHGKEDCGYC